jgi:hypothetical protein
MMLAPQLRPSHSKQPFQDHEAPSGKTPYLAELIWLFYSIIACRSPVSYTSITGIRV